MDLYIAKIQKAEALKTELDLLMPMKHADEDRLWQKFRLEWNYNSNHIEGNTLTYHETQLYLIFDQTTGNHTGREYSEMKAHDVAIDLIRQWADDKQRDISESEIRKLNEIILVEPYWKKAETQQGQKTEKQIQIGKYKQLPNSVKLKSGKMHLFASPEETPAKMMDLMNWYHNEAKDLHPFQIASEFHHRFVSIHPFDDGNGRVARLVMNYILLKNGYPPVIIKSKDKENYYASLRRADLGELSAFVGYITDQLVWSLEMAIKAGKGESIEEMDDVDKKLELIKRQLKNKDVVRVQWNKEVLTKTIYDVILPFFYQIRENLSSFDELFLNKQESIYFKASPRQLSINLPADENDIHSLLLALFAEPNFSINEIDLYFSWAGFKHSKINPGNMYADVQIYFRPYNYTINFNASSGKIEETLLYDETLSKERTENLISPIKKHLLEVVENTIASEN